MADKLKPCPFCGGDNTDIISADIIAGTQYWRIHCYGCGCTQTPVSDKEEAIEKWNNRPSSWHTGTPTEEGDYIVALDLCGLAYKVMYWNGVVFEYFNDGYINYQVEDILAYQKIEPFKED